MSPNSSDSMSLLDGNMLRQRYITLLTYTHTCKQTQTYPDVNCALKELLIFAPDSLNTFAKGGKRKTILMILPPHFSPSCFGQSKFLH